MATDTPLYLAFRTPTNSKLVVVTDSTKYFFPVADWQPKVGKPFDNGYQDVIEELTLQAIGATGADVMANVTALQNVLFQAARWAAGENVEPILMDLIVAGSNPAKVMTQIVKDWDAESFLASNFYHTANSRARADMLVRFTRSGVFYHTSYRHENNMPETDFGTVAPTTTASGVTTSVTSFTGRWGGRAYLQATKTNNAAANFYINNLNFPVTNGQSYTLKITMSVTNITKVTALFVKTGPVAAITNLVDMQLITDPITNGTTSTVLLTGTASDIGYLYFQVEGPTGATFRLAEVLIVTGNIPTERWHPQYSELATSAFSSSSSSPDLGTANWRWSHNAYSPVLIELWRTNAQTDYRHPAQFAIFSDKQTGLVAGYSVEYTFYNGTYGAPFTQVLEADAFGGSVVRYTPAATTVQRSAWTWLPNASGGFSDWNGLINTLIGLRNNSATTSFTVWLEIADYTDIVIAETPKKVIAANATAPAWYLLGIASVAKRRTAAKWRWCVQANAVAGSIDLNPAMFEKVQTGARVVQTDTLDLGATKNFRKILIDPQPLVDRGPAVSAYDDGVFPSIDAPFSWWTSPIVHVTGSSIAGYMLAMNGAKWKTYLTGGITVQTWQMRARRWPAYPTPE